MKALRTGLGALFFTLLIQSCGSTTEQTSTLTLPTWAAPAEIHQPATTIQAPQERVVGDLGWKSIQGVVTLTGDAVTLPVRDAELILRHHSIVHPPGIELSALSDPDGSFEFPELFIHDSDVLILQVTVEGQSPIEFRFDGVDAFYRPSIDLSLDSPKSTD